MRTIEAEDLVVVVVVEEEKEAGVAESDVDE